MRKEARALLAFLLPSVVFPSAGCGCQDTARKHRIGSIIKRSMQLRSCVKPHIGSPLVCAAAVLALAFGQANQWKVPVLPEDSHPSHNLGPSSDSSNSLTLYFAGDCTLTNHFEDFVGERFEYPFQRFRVFSEGDLSMANLENPITERTQRVHKEFNFKMNPRYLKTLQDAGIRLVTLANNHIFDYGPAGLLDTIHFLDSMGIKHVGAGPNLEAARQPAIFDIKGVRLGFLGYFGSGVYAATKTRAGVAPRARHMIKTDIQKLKESDKLDYVVVNFHWGKEKALYPEDWRVALAHFAVECGADLVVGHHPHVLQGVEKYKDAIIAYSLGNFLFGGKSRSTYNTVVLKVEIRGTERRISLVPVRVENWQPSILTGEEGEGVIATVKHRSNRFRETIF
jgi:poly-gamma-glutamate capsule biosynthesis protein CapA/YwtB (metallophosphatase superfamily)